MKNINQQLKVLWSKGIFISFIVEKMLTIIFSIQGGITTMLADKLSVERTMRGWTQKYVVSQLQPSITISEKESVNLNKDVHYRVYKNLQLLSDYTVQQVLNY
ncbi:hypothetical protein AAULR_25236 [Lacticaseibacillus rhamnosus MTCC 5462]|nr:hypothetical protein AAULR_25236 [Lacticaseibacillus rhamnosus MTCC 5462]